MNNTQIPIDELYDQLTLILQEEKYAKSTIQLYQEHVKRIKKFMLANNITDYSSSVADQYYKKEVESRDYNYTTKRFFRTVIRRLNNICSGTGFVYSVPRKDLSVPEQYHAIKADYLEHCRKIGNRPITLKTKEQEVCDLTVKSVNFRSTGTTIDIVGKGSKARRIRIPDPCASMLRTYIRHRRIETEPDRHIFSSQTHEHMTISCVEEIYKKYIKLAKEKTPNLFKEEHYSPHSMRHTTGQHMLEAGVPIMVIKAFLGHASVQTTQIYTESPQATVDKHIREWNEMNFPRSIYIDEKDLEERNVPDFLKSH